MSGRSKRGAPAPVGKGSLSSFFNKVANGVVVPESRAAAAKGAAVVAAVALDEEDLEARDEDEDVMNAGGEFAEEEVNDAVAEGVAEEGKRHEMQKEARQKKGGAKRERASAPDDLRAACFVFFEARSREKTRTGGTVLLSRFSRAAGA
jgi:TPP-dependent indolepyruvate ferredoxin oxidoreductase alpha subunit